MEINQSLLGIFLALLGGFLNGSFVVFLKYLKRWRWENFWLIFSVIGLCVFPFAWLFFAVPNFINAIANLELGDVALPMIFGALWGIGSVLFGLSAKRIGMAMTFTIVLGLTSAIGTIMPLLLKGQLPDYDTLKFLTLGLLILLIGVAISGYAGRLRDKMVEVSEEILHTRSSYGVGILMAVLSGIFSPMINVGLVYGDKIFGLAEGLGSSVSTASLFSQGVVVFGGFFVNASYSMYLLFKNKSWSLFALEKVSAIGSIASGILWFSGVGLYAIAVTYLGAVGTSVGYAILVGSAIFAGSFWGIVYGEWKVGGRPLIFQIFSSVIVIAGITFVSLAA